MNELQQKEFIDFLDLMDKNNVLQHIVVVGSWAEFLYEKCNILNDFISNTKTQDIDFLIKNLRTPNPPIDIVKIAYSHGYTYVADYMDSTTKLYTPQNMEIEFLIGQQGSGEMKTLKTNLGVTAQALRHMGILLSNLTCVKFDAFNVNVPYPEAYVVHKMVINKQRGKKIEKDRIAIQNIWQYVNKDRIVSIINMLSKKERKSFNQIASELNITL